MSKITFLLSQSLDSPSGLGRYGPLAKELVKLGHKVEIIALHPTFEDLSTKEFEQDGFRLHYVAQMHVRKTGDIKSYYPTTQLLKITFLATWQLSKSVLAGKSEIIFVGKPHPMNSIAGLLGKVINRSKLILDCDDFEAASGRFGSGWQRSIVTWFEKWMPHQATFVTTNTKFMLNKLINWGIDENKIVYVPNGIDKDRFSPPDHQELDSLREDMSLNARKVVLFVGSLSLPSHPVGLLLGAFKNLIDQGEKIVLILVGGGEDLQNLIDQVTKLGLTQHVNFCGRVPPEKVPLYYSLADVSTDPVNDDDAARGRAPLKLFESWASGVPFVCGDVGDRRFLLGDPPAGVLVQPGDQDAFAKGIYSIISNPELAGELRQRGIERIAFFTWDQLARTLDEQISVRIPN